MNVEWPEIFNNPEMFYHADKSTEERTLFAIVDGCIAWGNCMMGAQNIPSTFGETLIKLTTYAKLFAGTPEEFLNAAQKINRERNEAPN